MSALHSNRDDFIVACAQAGLSTKQIKMLLEVDHGVIIRYIYTVYYIIIYM